MLEIARIMTLVAALLQAQPAAAPEPKAAPAPVVTIRDRELGKKLALLENWRPLKGTWTQENSGADAAARSFGAPDGFRGAGDSTIRFKDRLPKDVRLEFTLTVVEGVRPRMYFDGLGFFFGDESFEKTLFVHGPGAAGAAGNKLPYVNDKPMEIRIDFWGEEYSIWVDGKLSISGKRQVPTDGIGLVFRGGDGWSKGTCVFSRFAVFVKP